MIQDCGHLGATEFGLGCPLVTCPVLPSSKRRNSNQLDSNVLGHGRHRNDPASLMPVIRHGERATSLVNSGDFGAENFSVEVLEGALLGSFGWNTLCVTRIRFPCLGKQLLAQPRLDKFMAQFGAP